MKVIAGALGVILFWSVYAFAEPPIFSGVQLEPLESGMELKIALFCPAKESSYYELIFADENVGKDRIKYYPEKNVHIRIDPNIPGDMNVHYVGESISFVFASQDARDRKIKKGTLLPCLSSVPPPFHRN